MPPVISIVGKSSSGKTTFLEKLIREITSRGYKVATIKHSHHSISFDLPNKDSWRHARAGALATMVSSTTSIQIIKPVENELKIEELVRYLGEDFDIIFSEGFSRGNAPKIEVHRKEAGPLLESASNLVAVATDEPLDTEVKQYGIEDARGVAALIEEKYLKPNRERVSVFVNGQKVQLSSFQYEKFKDSLLGLAKGIDGVKDLKSLEIHYHAQTAE
jgi:molybdopterin-guanine dinucleotide biosynthesis adapter protein